MAKADAKTPQTPQRKLWNVTEQKVMKTGILRLSEELTGMSVTGVEGLLDFSNRVLKKSFFEGLITKRLELRSTLEGDVCAAQLDIKHLTLQQQLRLRAGTLDFQTESNRHSAHNNFLTTLDENLFQQIARHSLQTDEVQSAGTRPLHRLGLRLALVRGAAELIATGWGRGDADPLTEVPSFWALSLDQEEWPDCKVAVFNVESHSVKVLAGAKPDVAAACDGALVVVVIDRSKGSGKDRMFHWDLPFLDPNAADVLEELGRNGGTGLERQLTAELAGVLEKHRGRRGGMPEGAYTNAPVQTSSASPTNRKAWKKEVAEVVAPAGRSRVAHLVRRAESALTAATVAAAERAANTTPRRSNTMPMPGGPSSKSPAESATSPASRPEWPTPRSDLLEGLEHEETEITDGGPDALRETEATMAEDDDGLGSQEDALPMKPGFVDLDDPLGNGKRRASGSPMIKRPEGHQEERQVPPGPWGWVACCCQCRGA